MLYKYKEINKYTLDALSKDKIWYSHPKEFNDIFDTNILIEHCKNEYPFDEIVKARDRSIITNNEFNNIITALDGNAAILCLSEDPISNAMWSYYADYHKGFCMEFEFDEKNDVSKTIKNTCIGIECLKVNYVCDYNDVDNIFNKSTNKTNLFKQKSIEWIHEKEYRVIKSLNNKHNVIKTINTWIDDCNENIFDENYSKLIDKLKEIKFLLENNYFSDCINPLLNMIDRLETESMLGEKYKRDIEFLKNELSMKGELGWYPGRLTSIIFGARTSDDHKAEIIKSLNHKKDIVYKQIIPSNSNYTLNISNISPY